MELDWWPALKLERSRGFVRFRGRMVKIGERVGAILFADEDTVSLLGWGVYLGEEVPPPTVTFLGSPLTTPNPKIRLDSGQVVWGCQCWWGAEASIRGEIKYRTVVEATLHEGQAK